jgi:hypothetical protein
MKLNKPNRKTYKKAYMAFKHRQLAAQASCPLMATLWPVVSFNNWRQPYDCRVTWPPVASKV